MERRTTKRTNLRNDSLWLLSGLALASCGGGGVASRGFTLTGDTGFTDTSTTREFRASIGETANSVRFHSVRDTWVVDLITFSGPPEEFGQSSDPNMPGTTFARAQVVTAREAEVTLRAVSGVETTYTVTLSGADAAKFRYVQEGFDIRVVTLGAFDFENPTDAAGATAVAGDNIYEFTETYSGAGRNEVFNYRFHIENIPEQTDTVPTSATSPHKFTDLPNGDRVASVNESTSILMFQSIREGVVADDLQGWTLMSVMVMGPREAVVTFDVDNQTEHFIYTVRLTGPDADDFQFVEVGTGDTDARIETIAAPDYDNPTDHNQDNIYVFTTTYTLATGSPYILTDTSDTNTLHILDVV
jgi:hypothetical protein